MAFPAQIPYPKRYSNSDRQPFDLEIDDGTSPPEIESRFIPVKADLEVSGGMRKSYKNGRNLPLIGISWWSSHFGRIYRRLKCGGSSTNAPAIFINLQYGDVAKDLQLLKQAAPGPSHHRRDSRSTGRHGSFRLSTGCSRCSCHNKQHRGPFGRGDESTDTLDSGRLVSKGLAGIVKENSLVSSHHGFRQGRSPLAGGVQRSRKEIAGSNGG